MTADELREAVARAIWRANLLDAGVTPDDAGDGYMFFTNEAAAAISTVLAALEEPTEGMLEAGEDIALDMAVGGDWIPNRSDVSRIWSFMVAGLKAELGNA